MTMMMDCRIALLTDTYMYKMYRDVHHVNDFVITVEPALKTTYIKPHLLHVLINT